MEFHKIDGKSCLPWKSLESTKPHGIRGRPRILWKSIESLDGFQESMNFMTSMDPIDSMEAIRIHWNLNLDESQQIPLDSMAFYGIY